MVSLVTNDMLDAYSVAATWDALPAELGRRYRGLVDRIAPYGAEVGSVTGRERWRQVVASCKRVDG